MSNFKTFILCADDFGFNSSVSSGILKLAEEQRISAVSCMVNLTDFRNHAKDLVNLKNKVQTGLHFNLTEGYFASKRGHPCFSLKDLLVKTHLRLLKPSFVTQEFNAQLDCYIENMGELPDFIDGHQHVHQFPGIRQVILSVYEQRLKGTGTWIRATYPHLILPQYQLKAQVLAFTGGRALSAQLTRLNIPHNPCFSGVYDFNPRSDYRKLFRQWLHLAAPYTLIMCHPGLAGKDPDVIAAARIKEMDYFLSDGFIEDCEEYQTILAGKLQFFSRVQSGQPR